MAPTGPRGHDAFVSTLLPPGAVPTAQAAEVIDPAALRPLDAETRVTLSGFRYNRATRLYLGSATVANTGAEALQAPLYLVVAAMNPAGASIAGAHGLTTGGKPYYDLTSLIPGGTLAPGAATKGLTLQMQSPTPAPIQLDLHVYGRPELVNRPPTANAGPDQTARVGDTVTLDGSASSDLDGDPLAYAWSFAARPPGSAATLSDPAAVNPNVTLDKPGGYAIQLLVTDGQDQSAPDTVTVSTLNSPPVANAGPDQTARVNDTLTLDGSGSTDVDGQPLTYRWGLAPPAGSLAGLDDDTAVKPHFTVDRPGTYLGTLRVNDGLLDSAPDSVAVSTENSPPVANAGPDRTVFVGDTVTLDGSASRDADGDPLSYVWSLSGPLGADPVLSDPTLVSPTFAVDLPGNYIGQLVVHDGQVASAPDTVTVSTQNSRPVACIAAAATVYVGEAVTLYGTCSDDADGDPLGFQWSLSSTPAGSAPDLSGVDADTATLVPDLPGLYVVQLIVFDGAPLPLYSLPVTTTVTAALRPPVNRDPEIASTPPTEATVGQLYAYAVAAADPDGDALTYSLAVQPAGMSIDPATGLIEWTPTAADLAASPVAVTVQVADGHGGSDTQDFEIAVQPATLQPVVPP